MKWKERGMRRFLTGLTAILTVVVLIVGCSSSDDTADEPTTATSATTVAPPETATTAAPTTTTTAAPTTTTTVETTTETMEASSAVFEVTYVEGEGCTSVGPSKVPIGKHSFVLHDPSGELEALYVIRLDPDKTLQDIIDDQPAPGKWHPKPGWAHYTIDLGSGTETDDGTEFTILLRMSGPHVVLASLYYAVDTHEDRVHWYCDPSFTVVESSE
jgi:hypothetical protein